MKEDDEWSEERRRKDEMDYKREYFQDSDGHLHRYSDLSGGGSDGSLSFKKDLSPGKQGEIDASGSDEERRLEKVQSPDRGSNDELTFFEREKETTTTAKSGYIIGLGPPKEERPTNDDSSGSKLTGRKEDSGITTSTKTSSAPSSGKNGQASEPTQAEREGTPSSRPAQEAGTISGSSMPD